MFLSTSLSDLSFIYFVVNRRFISLWWKALFIKNILGEKYFVICIITSFLWFRIMHASCTLLDNLALNTKNTQPQVLREDESKLLFTNFLTKLTGCWQKYNLESSLELGNGWEKSLMIENSSNMKSASATLAWVTLI